MAKSSASRAKTKPIETMAELAVMVDRDTGTVSRWLKREDWPFAKRPPFKRGDVPKILRWVADTLIDREGAGTAEDESADETKVLRRKKLQQEIRKLHAQADTAETALARERGKLLDAAEVEQEWTGIGVNVRNGAQNLPAQLVPLALSHGMPHEAAPVFQKQAEDVIAGFLRHLSTSDGPEDDSDGEAKVS